MVMGDERPFLYLTDVSQSYAVLIIIALGQLSFLCLLKTINNQQRFVREMTSENSWEKRYDHDSFILGTALLYTPSMDSFRSSLDFLNASINSVVKRKMETKV